jgi:hypothetical protein
MSSTPHSRRIDALVSERVMGWKEGTLAAYAECVALYGQEETDEAFAWAGVLHYTSDPAADYLVLVKVRESWTDGMHSAFLRILEASLRLRAAESETLDPKYDAWLMYKPGDYSHAALLALGVKL